MTVPSVFWNIPPIQNAIVIHLARKDIRICIQASQALYACFIPFLWKTVDCNDSEALSLFLRSTAQSRYRHHVQSLAIKSHHIFTLYKVNLQHHVDTHGGFLNLTRYEQSIYSPPGREEPISDFISFAEYHHRTLRTLKLGGWALPPAFLGIFLRAVERATVLEEVSVNLEKGFSYRDVAMILNTCRNVDLLSINSVCGPQGTVWDSAGIITKPSRVRNLHFHMKWPEILPLISQFLDHCSLLEKLVLAVEFPKLQDSTRTGSLLTSKCPHLRHFEVSLAGDHVSGVETFLKECPPLKKLELSLVAGVQPLSTAGVLCHSNNLGHLDLSTGNGMTITELFVIAGYCPSLTQFRARVKWYPDDLWTTDTLATIQGQSWVFTGLQSLGLSSYNRMPCAEGSLLAKEILDSLYRAIGQLTLLHALELFAKVGEGDFVEPLLSGLKYLSGLKELRRLEVTDDKDVFTIQDLETIIRTWPKLRTVYGLTGKWEGIYPRHVVQMLRDGKCPQ